MKSHDYHIADGQITVGNDRVITTAERTWMKHSYCYVLPDHEIERFLGHSVSSFIVPALFSDVFLQAELLETPNHK